MFNQIEFAQVKDNAVDLIKNQWGLVCAGNEDDYNMMTVSWGAVGELWGMDMVTVYIRPERYTDKFVDENDYFTLSFFPEELKKRVHSVCGSKSGRDVNKTELTGLTPVFDDAPYFEEAKLVLVCKKQAKSRFEANQFVNKDINPDWYDSMGLHNIYYGSIEKVLISE